MSYSPNTQTHPIGRSDRGLAEYERLFGPEFYASPHLDIGAGDSNCYQEMPEGFTFVRLDPDYAQHPPEQPSLQSSANIAVAAPAENLPFTDNSFSSITISHVCKHLTRPQAVAVAAESLRVLAPGGNLYIFPAFWSLKFFHDLGHDYPPEWRGIRGTYHYAKPQEGISPAEFDRLALEIGHLVSYPRPLFYAARFVMSRIIRNAGTHIIAENRQQLRRFGPLLRTFIGV